MNEILKGLAEATGWVIPGDRIQAIASLYAGTMDDTLPVRELHLGSTPPAFVYKASEE